MFWFKKKPRPYPSVYSEWVKEFQQMDTVFIGENELQMFGGACLKDAKYSLVPFKNELVRFLKRQADIFFVEFQKEANKYLCENDGKYLEIIIGRYSLKYRKLFFFRSFDFLDNEYKNKLFSEMKKNLIAFYSSLESELKNISGESCEISHVLLCVERLKRRDLQELN